MRCLAPGTKWSKEKGYADLIPCGKCPACEKRRISNWTFRLIEEKKNSSSAIFATLTYDDINCPDSLIKSDLQKFFKRVRKETGEGIKYYAVGEYGGMFERPHYHAIIFNLPSTLMLSEGLQKHWKSGFVHCGEVTEASIKYVAGYVFKKVAKEKDVPEFSIMSKKMGLSYLTPAMVKYHQQDPNCYLTLASGEKISMPRYFKNYLFGKGRYAESLRIKMEAYYKEKEQRDKDYKKEVGFIENEFEQRERKRRLTAAEIKSNKSYYERKGAKRGQNQN